MGLQGGLASLGHRTALAPSVGGSAVPQGLKSSTGSSASGHQKKRQRVWSILRARSRGGATHFYPMYYWLKCNHVVTLTQARWAARCSLAVCPTAGQCFSHEETETEQNSKVVRSGEKHLGSTVLFPFTFLHRLNFSQWTCITFQIREERPSPSISILMVTQRN